MVFTAPAAYLAQDLPFIDAVAAGPCAVCGAVDTVPYAFGVDYELSTCKNVWKFAQCRQCQHVYLDPRPADSELSAIYPSNYYSYDFEKNVSSIAVRVKDLLDARKLRRIFGFAPAVNDYLDIGCGSGRFLRAACDAGLSASRVHGLELDRKASERLRNAGFDVRSTRAEDTKFAAESLDVVTLFHVIEHVADPGAVLGKVFDWLRPGGVVAVETPNIDSLDSRLFQASFWGGYHIPRHWHLFRPEGLHKLASRCGFYVDGLWYTTGHSFWLYSFHHAVRYNNVFSMPRLSRLFDPLNSLVALSVATGFDLARARLGFRTSSMLLVLRKPG